MAIHSIEWDSNANAFECFPPTLLSFIENLRKDGKTYTYPLHADAPHLFLAHKLVQIGTEIVGDHIVLY